MKEFIKQNGAKITIDDNGIATVSIPKLGTGCTLGDHNGVRFASDLWSKSIIVRDCSGMGLAMLKLEGGLKEWLEQNWTVKELHDGWGDHKPESVKAYERWEAEMDEYRYQLNRSFDTEEVVIVDKPTTPKPELDAEAKAWLHIDTLCDSNATIRFCAGLEAKREVLAGRMTLVQASEWASKKVEEETIESMWNN